MSEETEIKNLKELTEKILSIFNRYTNEKMVKNIRFHCITCKKFVNVKKPKGFYNYLDCVYCGQLVGIIDNDKYHGGRIEVYKNE